MSEKKPMFDEPGDKRPDQCGDKPRPTPISDALECSPMFGRTGNRAREAMALARQFERDLDECQEKLAAALNVRSAGAPTSAPYSYEALPAQGGGKVYRIRDANDNALGRSYEEGNAKLIVEALNRSAPSSAVSTSEPPAIFSAGKWVYMGDTETPASEHDSRELDAAAWHKLRTHSATQASKDHGTAGRGLSWRTRPASDGERCGSASPSPSNSPGSASSEAVRHKPLC